MNAFAFVRLGSLGLLASRLRGGGPARPRSSSTAPAKVSIVIPARNEAARIGACLDSLSSAPAHEVVVVDDDSTDATAEIARIAGARVVTAPPLPAGWVGKPWALQVGLEAATGDIIVCLDADVVARPGLVESLITQLGEADLVSFTTSPQCASLLDAAVHASLLTSLVYRFGTRPKRVSRLYVNGQCFAFRRNWLEQEGGFVLAAGNLTDDVALARALASRGARISVLDGSDFLSTHMYASATETFRQWPRSLPMNDCSSAAVRVSDTGFLWLTMVVPVLRLLTGKADAIDLATLTARVGTAAGVARAYRSPGAYLAPLFDVASVVRLSWTTLRPVKAWRDRTYE